MTFDLVRCGWPNAMVVLTLAVMPFVSLGLPSEQRATPAHAEIVNSDHSPMIVGIASPGE